MPDNAVLFFVNRYFPQGKSGTDFRNNFSFHHEHGVAFHNQDALFASGVNHGGSVHFATSNNPSLIVLKDWIAKSFGDTNPVESTYIPGTVYKRIFRPLASTGSFYRAISQELTESFVSLRILLNKLEELFETLEPAKENLSAYGHKIREILLLACMEVESSWSAVLKDNAYASPSGRLTTNDYVKLLTPMLLDSYELSLQSYPRLPSFTPFVNWDASYPTESLTWYDAYNKTKHDREENLKFATLQNAIHSVGAAVVMFHAQFGFQFGLTGMDQKGPVIRNVFRIVSHFDKYPHECYKPKYELLESTAPTPTPSFDWQSINYPF
jgi:hypothetical protein